MYAGHEPPLVSPDAFIWVMITLAANKITGGIEVIGMVGCLLLLAISASRNAGERHAIRKLYGIHDNHRSPQ